MGIHSTLAFMAAKKGFSAEETRTLLGMVKKIGGDAEHLDRVLQKRIEIDRRLGGKRPPQEIFEKLMDAISEAKEAGKSIRTPEGKRMLLDVAESFGKTAQAESDRMDARKTELHEAFRTLYESHLAIRNLITVKEQGAKVTQEEWVESLEYLKGKTLRMLELNDDPRREKIIRTAWKEACELVKKAASSQ
ncbi:Uncharacterised protein [uncultured archaeon]|nr:Uncharacterised protein [uncultured archaeon]